MSTVVLPALSSDLLSKGRVLREPVGAQPGYWAGAPGVSYAAAEKAWYLTYRVRRPRGVAPDRGGEARIARSRDWEQWQDVWSLTKDKLNSASIERCALRLGPDGWWRYFISYVDPADGRWCVSVLKAREVAGLSVEAMQPVFNASALGLEGVKDPWLLEWGGTFYMWLSVALSTADTRSESHATLDIFNTGQCVSATALAQSADLDHWEWSGVVLAPGKSGWDRYCRRLNSVLPGSGKFYGFYDGSAGHEENYEERTGWAVSSDLRSWQPQTPDGPLVTSPHCSGSLRYVDAQIRGEQVGLFYEFARADGAHDLRLALVPLSNFPSA
jgi:hypothetical protein